MKAAEKSDEGNPSECKASALLFNGLMLHSSKGEAKPEIEKLLVKHSKNYVLIGISPQEKFDAYLKCWFQERGITGEVYPVYKNKSISFSELLGSYCGDQATADRIYRKAILLACGYARERYNIGCIIL